IAHWKESFRVNLRKRKTQEWRTQIVSVVAVGCRLRFRRSYTADRDPDILATHEQCPLEQLLPRRNSTYRHRYRRSIYFVGSQWHTGCRRTCRHRNGHHLAGDSKPSDDSATAVALMHSKMGVF